MIGPPRVITKQKNGKNLEPFEVLFHLENSLEKEGN